MSSSVAIEIVGYVASALVVASIVQKSILRLRLIGLISAVIFFGYAVAIEAYPIAIVNLIVAGIHLWFLRKLIASKAEVFRVLRVLPESRYLIEFLDFYADEIQGRFQPDFVYEPSSDQVAAFILRDMVPAGLLIGHVEADGSFHVKLDFVIPQYRDFKIGSFVYSTDSALIAGIAPTLVWTDAANVEHAKYLKRIGFSEHPTRPNRFEIEVTEPVSRFATPAIEAD
jgi:hypothetical protein